MNILVFTKGGREVPSSNVRVWIPFERLKKDFGTHFDIFHSISYSFWSLSEKRFKVWKSVLEKARNNRYDVLFVHKVHFPFDIALLIVFLKLWYRLPVVYDIDDPQWLHSKAQDYILSKIAGKIFCSSKPFMERYKKYNTNVVFVPTGLDHEWFGKSKALYQKKDICIIGWIGAQAHFKDGNFHIVKPALEELGKKGYKIEFKVIGTRGNKDLEDYLRSSFYVANPIPFVPYEEVPKNISQFDIAVAPVVATEWFEINATGKGVEYMACGVPIVASRVGAYKHLIQDGENGFLAGTTDEWVNKIERLLKDVSLREKIGEAGLKTVENGYSYRALVPIMKKEFEEIAK